MEKTNSITIQDQQSAENFMIPFGSVNNMQASCKMARVLASSTLVPVDYRGEKGVGNCVIAMDIAARNKISPLVVMQNMYVVEGRPSWSSQFLIGAVNSCGRFSSLKWRIQRPGRKIKAFIKKYNGATEPREIENITCVAYAKDLKTGEELTSPEISIQTAVDEGWYSKKGSKWQTMPELMLRYRTAAAFCRCYCPEITMGVYTTEEVMDIEADAADAGYAAEPTTSEREAFINSTAAAKEPVKEEIKADAPEQEDISIPLSVRDEEIKDEALTPEERELADELSADNFYEDMDFSTEEAEF